MKKIFIKSPDIIKPVLRLERDRVLSTFNPGSEYYHTWLYLCDSVYIPRSYTMVHSLPQMCCEIVDVDEEYAKLYDFMPVKITFDDIQSTACKILTLSPRLRSSTCMGWQPYDDKSKNPNIMNGEYIFPDGNTYTIELHKGNVRVFPGELRYNVGNKMPLVEFRIDMVSWAEGKIVVI